MPNLPEGYRVKKLPPGYKPKEEQAPDTSVEDAKAQFLRMASQAQMVNPRALSAGMKLASGEDAREDITGLAGEAALNFGVAPLLSGTGNVIQFLRGLSKPGLAAALKVGVRETPVVGRMVRAGGKATQAYEEAAKAHLAKQAATKAPVASAPAPTTTPASAPASWAEWGALGKGKAPTSAPAAAPAASMEAKLAQSVQAASPVDHPSVVLSKTLELASKNPTPAAAQAVQDAFTKAVQNWKAMGYTKEKIVTVLQRKDFGQTKAAAKAAVDAVF